MDKPTNFAYSDEATFRFFRAEIIIFFVILISAFVAVLITEDVTLPELILPGAVMSAVALVIVGIFVVIARGHRHCENILINRMFSGEIWECWQFSSSEWQAEVDAVCNLISPEDEGLEAYSGVIASSIFGAIIALIMILITIFVIDQPEIKIAIRIGAGIVFLLLVGIGLFQPLVAKNKADRYRRKALQIREPRVWFGPDGVYHETLGYTSLKELNNVTDQTKSHKRIQFTLVYSTGDSDDLVRFPTPVPSGCEERAGVLVRSYQRERLLN